MSAGNAPLAAAGKADTAAPFSEAVRSHGLGRGFMRAPGGGAEGLGGTSLMSSRMFGGVWPFSSISSTCELENLKTTPNKTQLNHSGSLDFQGLNRQVNKTSSLSSATHVPSMCG